MAAKLILSSIAATALMGMSAFAQVQSTETDPRFMPRVYGSTAVTGADYGQGAAQTQIVTSQGYPQPAVTYSQAPHTVRVEAPVTQSFQTTIDAPITYTQDGVIKAQHFKQGDLSTSEYNALLEEAARVRAYQVTNENYSTSAYGSAPYGTVRDSTSYEIELFETNPVQNQGTVTYADTTPVTPSYESSYSSAAHVVTKGDTLYNISKRYATTVDGLKAANALRDNTISLGQVLTIPDGTRVISQNSYTAPQTMAYTTEPATVFRASEPVYTQSSNIYAVLPKDTLYSISRRACVGVGDLIAVNGISDPSSLKPGQRLTMPSGHCLN